MAYASRTNDCLDLLLVLGSADIDIDVEDVLELVSTTNKMNKRFKVGNDLKVTKIYDGPYFCIDLTESVFNKYKEDLQSNVNYLEWKEFGNFDDWRAGLVARKYRVYFKYPDEDA